jgi:hypothetical protein
MTTCKLGRFLDHHSEIEPEPVARLTAVINDPEFTTRQIRRIVRQAGQEISQATIQRHRNGECACR